MWYDGHKWQASEAAIRVRICETGHFDEIALVHRIRKVAANATHVIVDFRPVSRIVGEDRGPISVKRSTIYNLINNGKLQSVKVGGTRLIPDAALRALLEAHR